MRSTADIFQQHAGSRTDYLKAEINTALSIIDSDNTDGQLSSLQQLAFMALTDDLTSLAARSYFDLRIKDEINKSIAENRPVSIILFDIDHFKKINDIEGHATGDRVLCELADLTGGIVDSIQKLHSADKIYARLGGDEFAVIMPGASSDTAAAEAERIRAKVENHTFTSADGSNCRSFSCSFGVATFPPHAISADELLEAADRALYKSKENGRNRVTVHKHC